MNLNLENKVAVVCGSTQGIGKAAAIEMASMGASLVLIARNEEKLIQTKLIDKLFLETCSLTLLLIQK